MAFRNQRDVPIYHSEKPLASTSYLSPAGIQEQDSFQIFDLTGQVVKQHNQATGGGGFADVYKALWKSENVWSLLYMLRFILKY